MRLDRYLSERHPTISRARWQEWIEAGQVRVNGKSVTKPAYKLHPDDTVDYTLPPDRPPDYDLKPEAIPVPLVYEDEFLLVVNKPRGLTVHPAPGHPHGTLVNALLAHSPALSQGSAAFRPGIVHRLDKDTTGLLIVAKTDLAHARLSDALQRHAIDRRYLALVWGAPQNRQFTVNMPIGRHPVHRKKMAVWEESAVLQGKARPACTHFTVRQAWRDFALLAAQLETGRTHQVRVHASALGHPVVGDPLYGGVRKPPRDCPPELANALEHLQGQLLHAYEIAFQHPITGERLEFRAPLPEDFAHILGVLEACRQREL
ncbi:MAG: RluA family pseudouridine synthase [Armatimonadetes bacterium JP3_11]|jgi:23S rRNA pseudouridine1911/1915/1917 synthase|nr:MAG: RluA family pseudouridine synthase [Armatimonadetes bacterium CP1_7O]OYT75518.1 MAG: RluA family pseudouridine synthase [Armatimonadetes bacterium JP3_11]RMH07886.1 MAG: RluA family pseudouridine synthase [Armatimonadota bacterium]